MAESYTPSELLVKKKKNGKSTKAQEYMLYTVREAAKEVGLWDTAPYLKDVAYAALEGFNKKVLTALPQLAGCEASIRQRLSATLQNRRNQLKNVLNWKRTAKLKKWEKALKEKETNKVTTPSTEDNTVIKTSDIVTKRLQLSEVLERSAARDKELQENGREMRSEEEEDDDFAFHPGDEVYLMDGVMQLGRASFIRISKSNDAYAIVALQICYPAGRDQVIARSRGRDDGGKERQAILGSINIGQRFRWLKNQLLRKGEQQQAATSKRQVASKLPMASKPAVAKSPPAATKVPPASTPTAVSKRSVASKPSTSKSPRATSKPPAASKRPAVASKPSTSKLPRATSKPPAASKQLAPSFKPATSSKPLASHNTDEATTLATESTCSPAPMQNQNGWKGYVMGETPDNDVFQVTVVLEGGAKRARTQTRLYESFMYC